MTTQAAIDEYQLEAKFILPPSYCSYCMIFGAGEIAETFTIAAPGYISKSRENDLAEFDREIHDRRSPEEIDEYCSLPEVFKRLIFFCEDMSSRAYGFDPTDRDDNGECAVFIKYRDFVIEKLAKNFWIFISDYCLGSEFEHLYKGSAPKNYIPA